MTWEVMKDPIIRKVMDKVPADVFQNERWFSEKSSRGSLKLADTLMVRQQTLDTVIALNLFRLEAGPTDRFYFIPFLITRKARPISPWFCKDGYYCYDGIPTAEFVSLVFQYFLEKQSLAGEFGIFEFNPIRKCFEKFKTHGSSSNSLLFVSDKMLVKNYRLVFSGIHPELEVGVALTENGFTRIPEIYGHLQYRSGLDNYALMLTQEMVANEGTAWEAWKDFILSCASDEALMAEGRSLGETIARLHLELEQMSRRIGQCEPLAEKGLAERIETLTQIIRDELASNLNDMAGLALKKLGVLRQSLNATDWGSRFRIHGDLHLEQILKTNTGWKVIDFEGEPLKPIVERGNWDSPLKDVASLLRSVSYRVLSLNPEASQDYEIMLQQQIINGYLSTYTEADGRFLPDTAAVGKLLELFQFERLIYEYQYELKYRPDWVRIPEAGLKRLLEKAP